MLIYATKIQCGWPINVQPKPCHHSQFVQCLEEIEATGPSWIALAQSYKFLVRPAFCSHDFHITPGRTKQNSISNSESCNQDSMWLADQYRTKTMSSIPTCSISWRDIRYWFLVDCPLLAARHFWSALLFAAMIVTYSEEKKKNFIYSAELCKQDSMRLSDQCPTITISSLLTCSMSWRDRSSWSFPDWPWCKLDIFDRPWFLQP